MGRTYTEAQKAATIKYLKEKTDDVRVRVPAGTKNVWQDAAKARGKSLTRFIIDVIEEEIAKS